MSAFYDDIKNLSAVLDSLHADVCVFQQPVLRLVIDHLRLLARQEERENSALAHPCSQTPPATSALPGYAGLARICPAVETRHDQ